MKETIEKTGLTYDILKFYCNEGLIPNVKRNKNNYRIFDDKDINWINNLLCLKGEASIPDRKKILDLKLKELEHKKQEIQNSIDYINWKHKFYNDGLSGKKNILVI